MIFIGVTGGIGSGKSLVCSFFEKKGVPVFFADAVAKEITQKDLLVFKKIVETFGKEILSDSGLNIDNKKLAGVVFAEPEKVQLLDAIIHPLVFQRFDQWKKSLPSIHRFALAEAALIFESGMDKMVDYVLVVSADEPQRIHRVMARDHTMEEKIRARMDFQLSQEELNDRADFVLRNDNTVDNLEASVNFFYSLFSNLNERKAIQ